MCQEKIASRGQDTRSRGRRPSMRSKSHSNPQRKGNNRPRKLPQKVYDQARVLADESHIPLREAAKVVTGELTLKEVLVRLKRLEELHAMKREGKLLARFVKPVFNETLPLEDALFQTRLVRIKNGPDYRKCFFADFQENQQPVTIAQLSGGLASGTVEENGKYDVTLLDKKGQRLVIPKHDIKFYFPTEERKSVLKKVQFGDDKDKLEPGALEDMNARIDVKARVLLEHQVKEGVCTWETVEGDLIRGYIRWFGRWEVQLITTRNDTIILLRHAFKSLQ